MKHILWNVQNTENMHNMKISKRIRRCKMCKIHETSKIFNWTNQYGFVSTYVQYLWSLHLQCEEWLCDVKEVAWLEDRLRDSSICWFGFGSQQSVVPEAMFFFFKIHTLLKPSPQPKLTPNHSKTQWSNQKNALVLIIVRFLHV